MHFIARVGFAWAVLASLSACNSTSTSTSTSTSSEPPVAAAQAAAVVAPPAYSGLASGSLGQSLDTASRSAANKAEVAALTAGERRTWRGENGAYGYIETGSANGDCREITHTVYINGRPNVGKGTACKAGESWKLNG